MDIEYKTLEERYASAPKDIRLMLSSTEISNKIQRIAEKHGLMLDQSSALFDLTTDVMLGFSPSKDYVKNLSKNAGIDEEKALAIANDINTEIFNSIRSSLQQIQSQAESEETEKEISAQNIQPPQMSKPLTSVPSYAVTTTIDKTISDIEKLGDFTIEKPITESVPLQYKVTNMDRDSILKGIEDPPEIESVSMIDHLLTTPVNTAEKKIEVKAPPTPTVTPEKKPYTADPYREQV